MSPQYTGVITASSSKIYVWLTNILLYFNCHFLVHKLFSCQNLSIQLLNNENFKITKNLGKLAVNIGSQLTCTILALSHFCPFLHFSIY